MTPPSITTALLPELDRELGTTRRLLERVPEDRFAWKPHEKSMSMGQLAAHVARLPAWTSTIADATEFDMAPARVQPRPPVPASNAALLALFDDTTRTARAIVAAKTDDDWLTVWTLRSGDDVVLTVPRISAFRTMVLNHSIHHRGQLSVYLRLNDVPLPAMYGPTADEP